MAVVCTAVWTPTGGEAVTLIDDGNRLHGKLEQLGGQGEEQVDPLAFGANPFKTMRGNVGGECVFTAAKSHANRGTALGYFKTNYGYIGQVGTLVITMDAATLTMANATFKGVKVTEFNGVRWTLRYEFGITTIT